MEYLQNGLAKCHVFFLRMENGIISLVLCGFYQNQDGVFWEISQKLCFWGFLLFLQKWPSYIKNRLGPLFFTTKPTYSLNLVKNGKAVWSESLVEVAALDRKQKWTITLQWRLVFATKTNTFATRLSFALHYFASLGPDLRVSPLGRSLSLWKLEYVRHRENNVANELWNWFQQNERSRGIFL